MSETPTVAEQAAAPPPPDGPSSDEQRPGSQPLAFLLTHQSGVVIIVALVIALLVGAVLIRLQGVAPLYAYETLIKQALFVPGGLTRTLQKTAPLVLTGLAVMLPLQVGLFNIGAQGQLIFGAMFGAWVAYAAGASASSVRCSAWSPASSPVPSSAGSPASSRRPRRARGHHDDHAQLHRSGSPWWLVTGPLQAESSKTSGIPQTG